MSRLACLALVVTACAHPTVIDPADAGAADTSAPLLDASLPIADAAIVDHAVVDAAIVNNLAIDAATPDLAPPPPPPLTVQFLGVAGFLLKSGDQTVLTAPLYTRPDLLQLTLGATVSDDSAVLASLPPGALDHVSAIVSGHAHYDHLIDAPALLRAAPASTLYANTTAQHLLAALAPDRPARCAGTPASPSPIDRARVFAFDDPLASHVDYRPCPSQRPPGAPLAGSWVRVPGSRVRLYATCSEHPDQVGPYHFGAGSVSDDQCELPTVAGDWLEGNTLSVLIDFLDENDQPVYRVYYQDAPTNAPIGLPPSDVLADKRVDIALLCVGNYDRVADAPTSAITALGTRFALGGHWEDFFRPASDPPQPLPLTDVALWTQRAQTAMPPASEPLPWRRAGVVATDRAFPPQPGDELTIDWR